MRLIEGFEPAIYDWSSGHSKPVSHQWRLRCIQCSGFLVCWRAARGATRQEPRDAAKKAGVAHFVYSSVGGAERNSGISHWESKWEIYYIDQVEIGILKGKLIDPIRAGKPYQTVATDDIGAFVALAFERPKEFIGAEIEIAGSELTNPEAAKVFSRVLGKKVKFQKLPLPAARLFLGKEFHQMFRWFNLAGFKADIEGLRRRYPEVHFRSLEEWLRDEGWHKRAQHLRAPRE